MGRMVKGLPFRIQGSRPFRMQVSRVQCSGCRRVQGLTADVGLDVTSKILYSQERMIGYRGTCSLLGPYSMTVSRALCWPEGRYCFL